MSCRRNMNIKTGHFCGLSSASDFRTWLKTTAPDLYDELANAPIKGCKSKQEKMISIKEQLYSRGKGSDLETFIQKRYPYMVAHTPLPPKNPSKQYIEHKRKTENKSIDHIETLNKHKVFKHYRPDLLTFPHKYIITGDPAKLADLVKDFITDKVGVDFIIIDDHAYIEYFPRRFSDVAAKMKPEIREIWIYKQKQKQDASFP